MQLIDHPQSYTYGHRVIFLKGRHKDGCHDQRIFSKHTSNKLEFAEAITEFAAMAKPGERIYASASPRDMDKAIRAFKHEMIDNDYNDALQRDLFYLKIKDRFISALMQKSATIRDQKQWLIDCDTQDEYDSFRYELQMLAIPYYEYKTKNGMHLLVSPFNRALASPAMNNALDVNALMLWGY